MVWIREINVRGPAGGIDPSDAEIIAAVQDAAGPAVAAEVEQIGAVVGIPVDAAQQSGRTSLPISWTDRNRVSPYPANYTATYPGSWDATGRFKRDVPLLNNAGYVPDGHLSPSIARVSDIPDPVEPGATVGIRVPSADVPVFGARLSASVIAGEPVAVVLAGSSTTGWNPGWTPRFTSGVQEMFPVASPTVPQWSQSAEFTERTDAGVHVYNTGEGGTNAETYLTDIERDRIGQLTPALIVHMVGTSNDYTEQRDPAVVQADLEASLAYFDSILTLPCQHVLVAQYERLNFTPATYPHADYVSAIEAATAGRDDTSFLDLSAAFRAVGVPGADPLTLIQGDSIHPTTVGFRLIGNLIIAFIVD